MAITLMDPEGLPKAPSHRQVAIASGSNLVFLAGQVAWDADGELIGEGDLAAQLEQCFLNVATALAAAGGSFDDVAKLTIYVVNWSVDKMSLLMEGIGRAYAKLGITPMAPASLIGVDILFEPRILVEVEAIAVLD